MITYRDEHSVPLKFTIRVPTKAVEERKDGNKIKIRLPFQTEQPSENNMNMGTSRKNQKNQNRKNSREEDDDEDFDEEEFDEEEEEEFEEEEEMMRNTSHSHVKIRIRDPVKQSIKRSAKVISSEEEDLSFSSSESEMDSKRFK